MFTAELTHGLAFSNYISFLLLLHTAINNLDSESRSFSGLGLGLEASGLGLEASRLGLEASGHGLGCCWT